MPTEREDERAGLLVIEKAAHQAVLVAGPQLHIERKWGHDWYVGTDNVCGVFAFQGHVSVEFWRGSTLPDPTHLLEGLGQHLRHVKLRSPGEVQTPAFRALLLAAVKLDHDSPKRTR
ncbi:MAG: DUF1801 domain-containing protein [Thermoplasmata archaeon]